MLLLALSTFLTPADAAEVLVLYDVLDGSTPALVTALETEGHTVTLSDVPEQSWDGTNPSLAGFSVVVHLNGTTFDDTMGTVGTQELHDFVELDGGGYVHFEWHAYAQSVGHEPALRDLTLMDRTSSYSSNNILILPEAGQENHPIFEDIFFPISIFGTMNVGPIHTFNDDPVTLLARDAQGNAAIAVRRFGEGNIVGFHHSGNWNNVNHFDQPILAELAAKAVTWASNCDRDDDGELREGACGGLDCDDEDPNSPLATVWYADTDNDGFGDNSNTTQVCEQPPSSSSVGDDCDDTEATTYPGAADTWYDGVDSDCAGDDDNDQDGDGYPSADHGGDDCDDTAASVHPGAEDAWYDGVDSDCGGNDDFDQDRDGHASADHGGDDCDDTDANIFGGANDTWYDGVDSDCAGNDDNDQDGDGFASADFGGNDCNDTDADKFPGAEGDNDCDGSGEEESGGCGCATGGSPTGGAFLLGLLTLFARRRRS